MANLNVALVGCGRMGQRYLQALVHCSEVDLIATADSDPEKAAAAAVPFDAASYSDMASLLAAQRNLDGVIIATPSSTHRQLAVEALTRGLNVLVERPMALTGEDARVMIRVAAEQSRILAVTQVNRLLPTVSEALDVFRQGRLGRLIEGGVSVRWARSQAYYDSSPWRLTEGGVLFNQAIAALDVLLQFSGRIKEVFAYTATLTHQLDCEDTVVGVLRAEDGALLTLNATTSAFDSDLEERLVVLGESGSIVLGPAMQQVEFWRVRGDDEDQIKEGVNGRPARPSWQTHLDAINDFQLTVAGNKPARLSGESALHVVEVLEALAYSAQTGQPVRVDHR